MSASFSPLVDPRVLGTLGQRLSHFLRTVKRRSTRHMVCRLKSRATPLKEHVERYGRSEHHDCRGQAIPQWLKNHMRTTSPMAFSPRAPKLTSAGAMVSCVA